MLRATDINTILENTVTDDTDDVATESATANVAERPVVHPPPGLEVVPSPHDETGFQPAALLVSDNLRGTNARPEDPLRETDDINVDEDRTYIRQILDKIVSNEAMRAIRKKLQAVTEAIKTLQKVNAMLTTKRSAY